MASPSHPRLSISLRHAPPPTPQSPTLVASPDPPSLTAIVSSLSLPSSAPSAPVVVRTVARLARSSDAHARIARFLRFYCIEAGEDVVNRLVKAAVPLLGVDQQVADRLAGWNDLAAAAYTAINVSAGVARYVHQRESSLDASNVQNGGQMGLTAAAGQHAGASSSRGASSSKGGAGWLRQRMERLAVVQSGAGLSLEEMAMSVLELLADAGRSDEQIQGDLFDAFGGDFDAVVEVLGRRREVVDAYDQVMKECMGEMGGERGRRKGRRGRRGRPEEDNLGNGIAGRELGGNVFLERERYFPGVGMDREGGIGDVDRIGLPSGSTREVGKGYEQIFVPPPGGGKHKIDRLVDVKEAFGEHVELLGAMKGVEKLNRLQSSVFPVAFGTDENLLVCAPTGAGKTNVALLTVFREILAVKTRMQRAFKVVYVAPMKALAAEVTEKFGSRLSGLGLKVREFTGDMSLSRKEALETHILVTTPEKWDVVTRKSGSELGDAVTLFIIDEIHLLHDDRGAVLESIVARTLRLSETAQRQIRLVGLSATLPNYADVGAFMRVKPEVGLFHFDASHRPVPLSQTFIGISEGGQSNSSEARRRRENKMHEMAWKKVKDSLQRGHQAMIFVHSRKGTSMAAREMLSRAAQDAVEDIFLGGVSQAKGGKRKTFTGDNADPAAVMPSWAAKDISRSKTGDIRELCARGVGIHNAGLPRPDRKLVEKLFAEGVIRLLCCTATLAWGVNLPARTVVIMGTEVYDAQRGGFVQLGMLDVMQIFGRAGRPQFDTEGEGTIITAHENLSKYLNLLTSSIPIESQLGSSASRLADHLNAEIVSGTVSSVGEGVRWLSYTYLSVRMSQNPLVYGIDRAEVEADSGLHSRRATLIESASKALDDARMCRYDPRTGILSPTDLGRVSSHFYVSHETVVVWNDLLGQLAMGPAVTNSDWEEVYAIVIHAVASATEFEQMRSRQEEADELDSLTRQACPIPLKSGSETREGKVAILLQAHISRAPIRMSDLSYVVQSSTRLLRAFFEIALRRGLPNVSLASLELARASETRLWPFQHPLWQFTYSTRKVTSLLVNAETVSTIEGSGKMGSLESLKTMTKEDLSTLIRAPKMAATVLRAVKAVPTLEIVNAKVAPLNRTVLLVDVSFFPSFRWNDVAHGHSQTWWMWLEDHEEDRVYFSQRIVMTKRQVSGIQSENANGALKAGNKTVDFTFRVPVFDPPSAQYWVRVESEQWHTGGGSSAMLTVSDMNIPEEQGELSQLLDLRPLPVKSALPEKEARLFQNEISHFNPLQTQAFHVARRTNENMLIAAPSGSGKWVIADLAILQSLEAQPKGVVVCIIPHHEALALREKRLKNLKQLAGGGLHMLDSRYVCAGTQPFRDTKVVLATPDSWFQYSSQWTEDEIRRWISLFVFDELHLMSAVEFCHMELVISRIRAISCKNGGAKIVHPRIVALSDNIPNAGEVASWLDVAPQTSLFSFDERVRQTSRESHVIGIAGDRYSSRMHSMSRTLFSMIQRYSSRKPVLIFVSSRRQTLLTAQDLIRLASIDSRETAFVSNRKSGDGRTAKALRELSDTALKRCVGNGIGLYHEKMSEREREAVEYLYYCGYVQVLVVTFSMSRSVSVGSHLVVVKGTETYRQRERRYEDIPVADILYMTGQTGRPGLDSVCYSILFVHEPKKTLFKKLLHENLPVESALQKDIPKIILGEISRGRVRSFRDAVEFLTWTFMFKRLKTNPGYYGLKSSNRGNQGGAPTGSSMRDEALEWCVDQVSLAARQLKEAKCISLGGHGEMVATTDGHLSTAHGIDFRRMGDMSPQLLKCREFEDLLKVLGSSEQIVDLVHGFDDDLAWSRAAERASAEACEMLGRSSKEVVAKNLGITSCNDSLQRRARVALCCLFAKDARREADLDLNWVQIHKVTEDLVAAGFEIAVERGILSLALELVRFSQALYRGLFPTRDVWILSGGSSSMLSTSGRSAGFVTIADACKDLTGFNAYMAKNCDNEAQRSTLSRWVGRHPKLGVKARGKGTSSSLVVEIDLERAISLSKEGVETHSRFTRRRNGGYVVIIGNAEKDRLYGAQRIWDDGGTHQNYSVAVHLEKPLKDEELHAWVISDIEVGVEAKNLVSV